MKKVKFTLGLALAMLITGANFVSAALVDRDVSMTNRNNTFAHEVEVTVTAQASPSYANSTRAKDWGSGSINDAITFGVHSNYHNLYMGDYELVLASTTGNVDLRTHAISADVSYGTVYNYVDFDGIVKARDTTELFHFGTIKLAYDYGVDIMPFVKRTIVAGKWMYDDAAKTHVMVPIDVVIEDYILPVKTSVKTNFTFGTDTAEYNYWIDLEPLFDRMLIYSINYDIWTNDMIGGDEEGPGYANKYHNSPVVIEAAQGIKTSPMSNSITPINVPRGCNFTFTVYGDASKELVVTTNDKYWTMQNGGVVVVNKGNGTWEVTITRVGASLLVKVGYVATTESGDGEDGQTGNGIIPAEAVWGSGGTLFVKAANPGTLSIYNVTGQLYKQIPVSGDFSTTLPKGLYIVQFNGKAYKVKL